MEHQLSPVYGELQDTLLRFQRNVHTQSVQFTTQIAISLQDDLANFIVRFHNTWSDLSTQQERTTKEKARLMQVPDYILETIHKEFLELQNRFRIQMDGKDAP